MLCYISIRWRKKGFLAFKGLLMLNKKLVEMTNEQLQQFYLNSRELLNF